MENPMKLDDDWGYPYFRKLTNWSPSTSFDLHPKCPCGAEMCLSLIFTILCIIHILFQELLVYHYNNNSGYESLLSTIIFRFLTRQ